MVVFPLVPVTATRNRSRDGSPSTAFATSAPASLPSLTTSCGMGASGTATSTTAAAAPAPAASATKAWASVCTPFQAKKRSPGCMVRESWQTLGTTGSPVPHVSTRRSASRRSRASCDRRRGSLIEASFPRAQRWCRQARPEIPQPAPCPLPSHFPPSALGSRARAAAAPQCGQGGR